MLQPEKLPVGAALIAFGAVKLIGYFSKDLYRLAFQFDLAFGALQSALGLVLVIRSESAMSLLCIILGIGIVADSLFKLQTAMDARRFAGLAKGIDGISVVLVPLAGIRLQLETKRRTDGRQPFGISASVSGKINCHLPSTNGHLPTNFKDSRQGRSVPHIRRL